METALYHPSDGYYMQDKQRVGRSQKTDFFTSSSFKTLFSKIVIEATSKLLEKNGLNPSDFIWTEIGAEPNAALLNGIDHPFAAIETIRIGETISIQGNRIVFSNELFDAQACHSVVFDDGQWKERFVTLSEDGAHATLSQISSKELSPYLEQLPRVMPEGYTIDVPTRSASLARTILAQKWTGVFIAFDYGKTWTALTHDCPYGTVRAYHQHQQKTEILANAGQQDLTCHICWDHLLDELNAQGFQETELESQESFVIKKSPQVMAEAFNPENDEFSAIRSQLRQLIHPGLMGQKFQVISALRKQH